MTGANWTTRRRRESADALQESKPRENRNRRETCFMTASRGRCFLIDVSRGRVERVGRRGRNQSGGGGKNGRSREWMLAGCEGEGEPGWGGKRSRWMVLCAWWCCGSRRRRCRRGTGEEEITFVISFLTLVLILFCLLFVSWQCYINRALFFFNWTFISMDVFPFVNLRIVFLFFLFFSVSRMEGIAELFSASSSDFRGVASWLFFSSSFHSWFFWRNWFCSIFVVFFLEVCSLPHFSLIANNLTLRIIFWKRKLVEYPPSLYIHSYLCFSSL